MEILIEKIAFNKRDIETFAVVRGDHLVPLPDSHSRRSVTAPIP
jgi:hypothetical protein